MKDVDENNNTIYFSSNSNIKQYINTPIGNKSHSSINNISNEILYFSINQDSK